MQKKFSFFIYLKNIKYVVQLTLLSKYKMKLERDEC